MSSVVEDWKCPHAEELCALALAILKENPRPAYAQVHRPGTLDNHCFYSTCDRPGKPLMFPALIILRVLYKIIEDSLPSRPLLFNTVCIFGVKGFRHCSFVSLGSE